MAYGRAMQPSLIHASAPVEPLRALSERPGVLAVITGVEGPSYRPVGAVMAILQDGSRVGTLSSGCIESDLAIHAQKAMNTGETVSIRYGRGSPFVDIQLPCGGGLDILLVPHPDAAVLGVLCEKHAARSTSILSIDPKSGAVSLDGNADVQIKLEPEIFFFVFGKGPEAATFAGLVQASGFPHILLSPDTETLAAVDSPTRHLITPDFPTDLTPDARSAVVLFFHDHEWEPPILKPALASAAFYVGAQGSHNASALRAVELANLDVPDAQIAKIKGPIGLIPSAKDARKLAVSVLAEVLSVAG